MTDTETSAAVEQEVPTAPNLKEILKSIPGSPSEADIEKWKQEFGEVHVSGFSEEELFIWHPISRVAYIELQKKMQSEEVDFEKAVVEACLLWALDTSVFDRKGGSLPTLSEQIMIHSNFMNPTMASMLVMKL